ncbi:MAG TPA: beta-N-acetylhexosaminidase [Kiritimatiellia bacterium]|nr:beta-N-acetylhexosaminidase [Kiritimatiellia bacterium]HMO98440.1 beta-N-acetylhexosaminidase [Kiritimatiellia bacterium]HMP95858.1 beta-N-acetylhexosaminidase [Kiritimatiellia bacterium]
MLDISRNKVPTMTSLKAMVDELAQWGINHVQLYTEHTFAYPGHEDIWRDASPMTREEVIELDGYCRARGIELVANQNSLGHLHRWLRHPRYLPLAECPDGYDTPWGERRSGPFSLNPVDPAALALLADWYDALLPCFSSSLVNVGCDEAFDLGQGKSRPACETTGKGRIYLTYLHHVKHLVEARGKTMMFWGDIILNYPELIPELERNAIALVWGYEADHPFDAQCRLFKEAGIPFWVCPGTSTWNSICGRFDNMIGNLQAAATAGRAHGAEGFLITEWGDNGHWQTKPFSRLALAAGAFAAWHGRAPSETELAELVAPAPLLIALGRVYRMAGFDLPNSSPLFSLIRFQNPQAVLDRWSVETLEHASRQVDAIMANGADALASLLPLEAKEIELAARMLGHALRRGRWLKRGQPSSETPALAADLEGIRKTLAELWLIRNRPGGLDESLAPLDNRLMEYRAVTGQTT